MTHDVTDNYIGRQKLANLNAVLNSTASTFKSAPPIVPGRVVHFKASSLVFLH